MFHNSVITEKNVVMCPAYDDFSLIDCQKEKVNLPKDGQRFPEKTIVSPTQKQFHCEKKCNCRADKRWDRFRRISSCSVQSTRFPGDAQYQHNWVKSFSFKLELCCDCLNTPTTRKNAPGVIVGNSTKSGVRTLTRSVRNALSN